MTITPTKSNENTMPEIMERLMDSGFAVSVNPEHTLLFVRLQNRQVSTIEVWAALDYQIDYGRLSRKDDAVVIAEVK